MSEHLNTQSYNTFSVKYLRFIFRSTGIEVSERKKAFLVFDSFEYAIGMLSLERNRRFDQ